MDSQEFINEITQLKPSRQELNRPNYGNDVVDMWLNSFEISKKEFQGTFDDPIIDLIKCNDISSLNINDVTFDPELIEDDEHIFFGWDINDRLAIQKSNRRIVAYDSFSGRITFECADNSSKFLGALVEIMKFFKDKILNEYEEEERDRKAVNVAYISALKAGSEQYEAYYKSILWID